MQYILTQEEYSNLVPKSKYENKCDSDIKKAAQDYIDNHIDCTLSGVDKSFLYEGYINGAIDILESLGTFIDSDNDEEITEKIKEREGYRKDFKIINHKE